MRATNFEFRNRFWFICLSYFVAFGSYRFDHLNVIEALAQWVFRGSDPLWILWLPGTSFRECSVSRRC